jgi:hypothetical protein
VTEQRYLGRAEGHCRGVGDGVAERYGVSRQSVHVAALSGRRSVGAGWLITFTRREHPWRIPADVEERSASCAVGTLGGATQAGFAMDRTV